MPSWPALLVAPLVALSQLSIAYALVTPACARQDRLALHAVSLFSLLLVVVMTTMAWQAWRRHAEAALQPGPAAAPGLAQGVTAGESDAALQRPHFVDLVAVLVGAISVLVSIALWLPVWFLSPCY